MCVWIPTVSGTHPVGSGLGPSVAWAHTSHSPDVVTALDTECEGLEIVKASLPS